MAPDVLTKKYSFEADIWSCGVILYLLICGNDLFRKFDPSRSCVLGEPPFYGKTREEVAKSILFWDIDFSFDPWPNVSPSLRKCIMRMLERSRKVKSSMLILFEGNQRKEQRQERFYTANGWLNNEQLLDNPFRMPFILN